MRKEKDKEFIVSLHAYESTPLAECSEAWVCGRLLTGIAGSNPAGDMDACMLWVLCVVR